MQQTPRRAGAGLPSRTRVALKQHSLNRAHSYCWVGWLSRTKVGLKLEYEIVFLYPHNRVGLLIRARVGLKPERVSSDVDIARMLDFLVEPEWD